MTGDQVPVPRPGDLVEYLPTGEWWTVDEVLAATRCKPQRFILGRSEAEDGNVVRGSVTDACAGQLRLVRSALERTLFEGSDWIHLIQDDLEVIKRMGVREERLEAGRRAALRGSPEPGPVWDGPWATWTRGKATGAVSWVTVACSGCATVPRDERRMPAVFATVEDARARLPRDWDWTVIIWPAGPGLALCPACAARVTRLPGNHAPARPAGPRQEGEQCPG